MTSIVGVVTDGGSNMKSATQRMSAKWFYCVDHMLHRAVTNALASTNLRSLILTQAKRLSRYFRSSNRAKREVSRMFSLLY